MTEQLVRMHCHYRPPAPLSVSQQGCSYSLPHPLNKSLVQNYKEGVSHVWFVGREEESSECVTATEEWGVCAPCIRRRAHNYMCEVGGVATAGQHSWAAVLLTAVEPLSVFTLIRTPLGGGTDWAELQRRFLPPALVFGQEANRNSWSSGCS